MSPENVSAARPSRACSALRGALEEDHELVVAHQVDETPAIGLGRRPDLQTRRDQRSNVTHVISPGRSVAAAWRTDK